MTIKGDTMEATAILTFRKSKSIQSWFDMASEELTGRTPQLLRMILLGAAYRQTENTGGLFSRLFGDKPARQRSTGGTKVYAVRMAVTDILLIRESAKAKNQDVGVWASEAVEQWYKSFRPFYDGRENDPAGWLTEWTRLYVAKFNQAAGNYARSKTLEAVKT